MAFDLLFSPQTIGPVTLRNRIVSTGHDTVMAHNGHVTDRLIAYHEARARGGVGLIIVQVAGVHPTARYTSHMLMADNDDCIAGYRKLADRLHDHGSSVFAQLFHPGREIMETDDGTAAIAYAPSAIPNSRFRVMPVPLSRELIDEIIAGYASAALRLKEAGLDGVELVASHGYLPAQFLNPHVNQRADDYGGSLANRMRFLRETARAIRERVAHDFAVGVRISGDERDPQAMDESEIFDICRLLDADQTVDYFHVIAGTSASLQGAIHIVPPMSFDAGYMAPFAARVKALVSKPVIVTGRINQPQKAEEILRAGSADFCGMTRALIADPDMPNKAQSGALDDIRACIACNQACIGHFHKGYPISCIQHPETGRELTLGNQKTKTQRPQQILVAGGGPAGLKVAAVLAERGHRVMLCDANSQLGGQTLLAQMLPGRAEFGGIATNLQREAERAGVDIHRKTRVTHDILATMKPDHLVIATGAKPRWPTIEGDGAHIVDAWQVLKGEANCGARIVIADWRADWIGLGLAEKLARDGSSVTLAVEGTMAGEGLPFYVRDDMIARLHRLGVQVKTYHRLFGADGDTVYFHHASSGDPVVIENVETLVLAQGHERVADLAADAASLGIAAHVIGDALTPRTAEDAVLDGLTLATANFFA